MTDTATLPRPAAPSPTTQRWVLALTSTASFMVALDALVLTTALTTIRTAFKTSIATLEWTANAYNISFAVLLLTGAALGDRFGRRRMFTLGLAVFVAASVACGLAGDVGTLIAARTVQGVGAALVMPLAMALLGAAFPPQERGRVLGLFGGITGLALIAGPLAGGAIVAGLAWPWVFWINLPVGVVVIALVLRTCPESFGPAAPLDLGGLALAATAALALVWALVRGDHVGWSSAEVLAALGVTCALGLAFVAWEARAAAPMVPLQLFASRTFTAGITTSFLFYAAMYSVVFFLPQFLQSAQGFGAFATGVRLLPWTATLFVFAPLGGRLVNRLGERRLVAGGTLLQAVGFASVGLTAAPDLTLPALALPLVIAGAGVSLAMPAAQAAVLGAVAPPELGKASGIFNMARFLGGVCGIALAVAVFALGGDATSPARFSRGFALAIGVAAALSLAAALVALALPGRREAASALARARA
ncbi:MAG: MFS transporter [Pseudomonadota bacterium]